MKSTKKKRRKIKGNIVSFIVAVVLILIVGTVSFSGKIKESINNGESINLKWFLALIYPDKYAYSKDMADLNEYFQLFSKNDIAIILQDERIEDRAKCIDKKVYFSFDTTNKLFTRRFYYNAIEKILLYTTSDSIIKVDLSNNSKGYYINDTFISTDYVPALIDNNNLYINADFIKNYSNFSYDFYENPNRVQVYTHFGEKKEAEINAKTYVRYRGGIKSEILTEISAGDKVEILEILDNWVKVKTKDCYIGYIEKNKLLDIITVNEQPVLDAYNEEEDFLKNASNEKIILGWHQISYADNGTNLNELLSENTCINVVCPTWYYMNSEEGTFENFANKDYVENVHAKNMQVWALCEDMTNDFDEYKLLSSSTNRKILIDSLITETVSVGADGINIDFENITKESGPHFIQFLRELSIETRKNGLILSVDNYHPTEEKRYYDLKEQGLVCDYVIIMNYDEHWATCSTPGSVASISYVEKGLDDAISLGVPKNKLINGMPFYTRLWIEEGNNLSNKAIGMNDAEEWTNRRNITPIFDDNTGQYYIKYQDGTATYEMWMEETDSIRVKVTAAIDRDIAGIACWKLGFEKNDIWNVIQDFR